MEARRAYEVMKHCFIINWERSIAAGTYSWSTNHLQLVSYAQSLMSQIVYGRVRASILIRLRKERILSAYEVQYPYST